ncbi:MAG: hypothetical protein WDO24_28380 [Pseudomonadota bacterium]
MLRSIWWRSIGARCCSARVQGAARPRRLEHPGHQRDGDRISSPLLDPFVRNCDQAWYGWPCDQRVPELTRQWTFETDPAKRREILDALQRAHLDNMTNIPLGQYRKRDRLSQDPPRGAARARAVLLEH